MYNAVRDFLINYENYVYMTPNMCGFYHFYVCASAIYLFNVILFVKVTNAFGYRPFLRHEFGFKLSTFDNMIFFFFFFLDYITWIFF